MTAADPVGGPTVPNIAQLLTAHAHGWALSKADGIEEWALGWRLGVTRVGEPARLVVVRGGEDDVRRELSAVSEPGTTLRAAGDPAAWAERLPQGWVPDHEGWYMARELPCEPAEHTPSGLVLETSRVGDLISVTACGDGGPIGGGRVGCWAAR